MRSAASCTSTETAPYAFVLGRANRRSATSRWTMTVQWPTLGNTSRLSTISGVATLYGRFATNFVGAGSSAARSRRNASPKVSVTFSRPRRRSARCVSSPRSSSTACTRATRSARYSVKHPQAGPDLEHDVVCVELGEPPDDAEDVVVDEEVLSEIAVGCDRQLHGSENAAAAFPAICAPRSSGSTPRALASASSVSTTFAGSLGRPRRACGAR